MMSQGQGLISYQSRPFIPCPIQITRHTLKPSQSSHHFSLKIPAKPNTKPIRLRLPPPKSDQTHQYKSQTKTQDDGIPIDDVKIIAKFKTRHNYIRVLEVSRRADHPLAGSRLLLLDSPGNIHSISFLFKSLTNTYFDVFATLPPILPPGPVGILGFGAGSTARLLLELYPELIIHGWELDPSVIAVGREYFGLGKLEKQYPGILVDLFSKGSLIPELQDPETWQKLRKRLRKGGRIMVNVGGSCVEAEDERRDGKVVMEETLKAMHTVFGDKLYVLNLGNRKDDSSLALAGELPVPDFDAWKKALPRSFKGYVGMWAAFHG